jgi:hypothetical protein
MTGNVLGERVMNNFSLLAANRLTHLKVGGCWHSSV